MIHIPSIFSEAELHKYKLIKPFLSKMRSEGKIVEQCSGEILVKMTCKFLCDASKFNSALGRLASEIGKHSAGLESPLK